jgi:preprotein translocase subunit SecF
MSIIKTRRIFFTLSALLLLISILSLVLPPSLNPGIDFSSGSTLEVRFIQQVDEDVIRDKLSTDEATRSAAVGARCEQGQ